MIIKPSIFTMLCIKSSKQGVQRDIIGRNALKAL